MIVCAYVSLSAMILISIFFMSLVISSDGEAIGCFASILGVALFVLSILGIIGIAMR